MIHLGRVGQAGRRFSEAEIEALRRARGLGWRQVPESIPDDAPAGALAILESVNPKKAGKRVYLLLTAGAFVIDP